MAVPSPDYKTADLLDLFGQLLPRSELEQFDIGHARVFTTWMVVWLMVYQRTRQGESMAAAVAEMILGATSCRLPECKRAAMGTSPLTLAGTVKLARTSPLRRRIGPSKSPLEP